MKRLGRVVVASSVAAVAALTAASCGTRPTPTAPEGASAQVLAGFDTSKRQGCFSCHQVQGLGGKSGPSFDRANTTIELTNGTTVQADEAYLRRALTDSDADIPVGYRKGVMTAAMNTRGKLTDQQVDDLVAYLLAVQKKP